MILVIITDFKQGIKDIVDNTKALHHNDDSCIAINNTTRGKLFKKPCSSAVNPFTLCQKPLKASKVILIDTAPQSHYNNTIIATLCQTFLKNLSTLRSLQYEENRFLLRFTKRIDCSDTY